MMHSSNLHSDDYYSLIPQVQRQLQMRIEAQSRYLQKIIEEQHKLSANLKASVKQEPSDNKPSDTPPNSGTLPDGSTSSTSPKKKQKLDG